MDTSNGERVRTEVEKLSLLLPPGWEVEPGEDEDDVLVASPPDDVDPVLVVSRQRGTHASAAECKVGYVIGLQEGKALPDYADHGGGEWDVGGRDVSWHSYGYATAGRGRWRVLYYCAVVDRSAYIVSCAAREENFGKHRPAIEAIGHSLRPAGTALA